MWRPIRTEGFAIVSADGMIADSTGVMPQALVFSADQIYFENALDKVDIVVHGRHSQESQPHSPVRRRLILTRKVAGLAADPANRNAMLWNPDGATLEEAVLALGLSDAAIGVIGGTSVFGLFLPLYDEFHLSKAPDVRLPGGRPVFPGVPRSTPEDVLAGSGLKEARREMLDPNNRITVSVWQRS